MEQIGFLPRSIFRTFQRFFKQINNFYYNFYYLEQNNLFAIYEFRISRYIAIASFQSSFFLILCPCIFNFFLKFFISNIFF